MTRHELLEIMKGLRIDIEAALESVFEEVISAREQRDEAQGEVERLQAEINELKGG